MWSRVHIYRWDFSIRPVWREILFSGSLSYLRPVFSGAPCNVIHPPLYTMNLALHSVVFGRRCFPAWRHKQSGSAASLTSSSVLSFLSVVLSITCRYSNAVKLNFKVFHLPNPAAFSGSRWWSRCGRGGNGARKKSVWLANLNDVSVAFQSLLSFPKNTAAPAFLAAAAHAGLNKIS